MSGDNPKSVHLALRCPVGLLELIDKDIEDSKQFTNRSQWLLNAISEQLSRRGLRRGGGLTLNSILLWGFFRCFSVNISIIMVLYDHFLGVYDQI